MCVFSYAPYILSGLIFFSFDPWILLNPERFASTYLMLKKWSSGSARPLWTAQFTGLPKGLYWFTSLIPTGFGIPMFIASIAGLVTSFFYRTRIMIPIIASGFLYWLMLGFSFMQYIRYTVPLCPVITILAGAGLFRAVVPFAKREIDTSYNCCRSNRNYLHYGLHRVLWLCICKTISCSQYSIKRRIMVNGKSP